MSRPVGSKNKRKPVRRVSKPEPADAAVAPVVQPTPPVPVSPIWRYAAECGLSFHQGRVVELVTHWAGAGGVADLKQAISLIEHMIAVELS